ncbi:MAG: hypothetical protein ACK5PD_12985 [Pirellulaceae bacterium]
MRNQSPFPPSGDGGYEEVVRVRQVATAAYAPAQVHPGGMTAAGDQDGAMGVLDDELEAQVTRSF